MDERAEIIGYWPGKRWKQARAVFDRGGAKPYADCRNGSEREQLRIRYGRRENELQESV